MFCYGIIIKTKCNEYTTFAHLNIVNTVSYTYFLINLF